MPSPTLSQPHSPVVINEIGWMGTSSSTTSDEWMELHNPSNYPIDLSGWVLKAIDGTPSIVLSGVIEAGGYFLLERTDDSSIPGISADQIYTGALGDSGEELELRDATGGLRDAVPSSSGWFAGDKDARKSMERKSAEVGGSNPANWQTSVLSPGTPRAKNSELANVAPNQTQSDPSPAVTFSAPSSVVSGQEFSVGVSLSNFEPGTYFVKVLIGQDGSFVYGNTKGSTGWLPQTYAWDKFPTIAVSFGSVSGTVAAKTDDGLAAGSLSIKVRVHKDGNNYDSAEKPLVVSASSENVGESTLSFAVEEEKFDPSGTLEEGKVLGEGVPQVKEKPKLNFYIIVGIFGLLVGGGGLILVLRGKLLGL